MISESDLSIVSIVRARVCRGLSPVAPSGKRQFASAVLNLKAAAAKRDLDAIVILGWLADVGAIGGVRCHRVAVGYYRQAASMHPIASYNLGAAYMVGRGVRKDVALARKWLQRAAEGGVADAKYELGRLIVSSPGLRRGRAYGLRLLREVARQGRGDAALAVAFAYDFWTTEPNQKVSAGWYKRAARLGSSHAMFNLGAAYEDGLGVPKDLRKAASCYTAAAAAGMVEAKQRLRLLGKQPG